MKKRKLTLLIIIATAVVLLSGVGIVAALNGWFGGGATIPSDTMTRGLVGYWGMDEGVGTTTADISGNSNTGVFATAASSPSWTKGKVGTGLSFDGSNDYVNAGSGASLSPTSAITIEAWVYWKSAAGRVVSKYDTASRTYEFYIDASGYIVWRTSDTGADLDDLTSAGTITANQWNHIAVRHDSNGLMEIFINGVKDSNASSTGAGINTYTTNLVIGIYAEDKVSAPFNGLIDEVRIYNRALTAAEVRYHYNRGGPVAQWKFDEGTGTTTYDGSGNGNNGTLQNNMATTSWTSGKYGSALLFDGVNDYVNIGNASSSQYTTELWLRANSFTGILIETDNALISFGSNLLNIYDWVNRDGKTVAYYKESLDFGLVVGNWYHLVLISTVGGSVKVYLNGIEKSIGSLTYDAGVSRQYTDDMIGGGWNQIDGFSGFFNGLIDDVRIYNYARTQDEIALDYNSGFAAKFGGSANCDINPGACMTKNLAVYLPFDEGMGTSAADLSGNSNTGTLAAGASKPAWTKGKVGGALSFDTNDAVTIEDSDNHVWSTTSGAVETWINPATTTAGDSPTLLSRWVGAERGAYDFLFYFTSAAGQVACDCWNVTLNSGSVTVATGTWSQVIATWGTFGTKLYVNGVQVGTSATLVTFGTSTQDIYIGQKRTGYNFQGLIDEVKIYNRSLSAQEVRYHYNRGGPVAQWKFDEGSGLTAYDSSGQGNTGTLQNNMATTSWTSGKSGPALNFDGINDYVNVPAASSINDLSQFTWESWVKVNTLTPTLQKIMDKSTKRNRINSNGALQLDITTSGTAGSSVTSAGMITVGLWAHVTMTYNDSGDRKIRIYVNGVESSYSTQTASTGTLTSDAADPLKIGADSIWFLNGLMDDIRIYNYARTQDEIALDYNAGFAARLGGGPTSAQCSDNPGACMTKGLVGFWNMEEGRGTTTADISGNNNTGVFATAASSPAWTKGKVGGGLSFDGTNDAVQTALSRPAQGTYEAWIYPKTITGGHVSIGRAIVGDTDGTIGIAVESSQIIGFLYNNVVYNKVTYSISANTWYHIVWTYNGSNLQELYVNGVSRNTNSVGINDRTTTITRIGDYSGGGEAPFDGIIDEVRIYNRALSAEEVRYHYNRGGPVAQWKFDEGSGLTAYDSSGNANTGTLQNNMATTSWTSGKSGSALNFDGVNDFVTVLTAAIFRPVKDFSVSTWVKFNRNTGNHPIIREYYYSSAGNECQWWLEYAPGWYGSATPLSFMVRTADSVETNLRVAFTPSLGAWYHLVVIYDGSKMAIYVNGALVASQAKSGNLQYNSNCPVSIAHEREINFANIMIDDVRIYNYARTQYQILQDYNGGKAVQFK